MTYDAFLLFTGFAIVSLFTPGPNNLMLMTSGANFGLQRTLPHMAGVAWGFAVMIALMGAGLGVVFDRVPMLATVLKAVSLIYLGWLAWKIAHAAAPGSADAGGRARPLTVWEAAAFQWINPKGWAIAMSVITVYAADADWRVVGMAALTYGVLGSMSASTWTVLGTQIRRILTNPRRLMVFNWTMATLLVLSVLPVVLD